MDFLQKQVGRFRKQSDYFKITLKPVSMQVNVHVDSTFYLIFKRGPLVVETKKHEIKAAREFCKIIFTDETFTRVSGFYKDKNGKYQ